MPGQILERFVNKKNQIIELRQIQESDINALHDYVNRLSQEDTFVTLAGEEITLEQEQEYLQQALAESKLGKTRIVLAICTAEIVGVCQVKIDEHGKSRTKHCGVLSISVSKNYRGTGIGKRLAERTISEAKSGISNLQIITLRCFANNTAGLDLYTKLGFREVGRLQNYLSYKGGLVDEVIMQLNS